MGYVWEEEWCLIGPHAVFYFILLLHSFFGGLGGGGGVKTNYFEALCFCVLFKGKEGGLGDLPRKLFKKTKQLSLRFQSWIENCQGEEVVN